MEIRLPWIIRRKHYFAIILLEALPFIIFRNYFLFLFSFHLFFSFILWLFISYLFGRYSVAFRIKYFNIKYFITQLKRYLISLLIFIPNIYLYNSIFLSSSNYHLTYLKYFSIYSIYSFFIIVLFKYYINKSTKKKYKWIVIGTKSKFLLFLSELSYEFELGILLKSNFTLVEDINAIDESIKIKNKFIYLGFNNNKNIDLKNNLEKRYFLQNMIPVSIWFERYTGRIPNYLVNPTELLWLNLDYRKKKIDLLICRWIDIFLSFFILIFSCPILLISSLLIYLEDKGNVFYSQKRVGLKGKTINIVKLRTMKLDAETSGPQWSKKSDPRILNIGKVLRKYRIDEIPQLILVILGDLSLIGPRPERRVFEDKLLNYIPFYLVRHEIKLGLSGWAQVNFPYGSSINDSKMKSSYDLYYIRNFSVYLYCLILVKTVKVVTNSFYSTSRN